MRTILFVVLMMSGGVGSAQAFLMSREMALRGVPRIAMRDLDCQQVSAPTVQVLERSYPNTTRERWVIDGCGKTQAYQLIVSHTDGKESFGNIQRETVAEESVLVVHDVVQAGDRARVMLLQSGYRADYSMQSLAEVDRFIDEHSADGKPKPGGLLTDSLGGKLFGLGGYVGETLRRNLAATWSGDDDDSDAEINVALVLGDGSRIWPVQRVMKRFAEGAENSLKDYGRVLATDPKDSTAKP